MFRNTILFLILVQNGRSITGLDARTYGKPSQKEGQRSIFRPLRASLLKLVKCTFFEDFGHFKLRIYDQYIHQKHSCSWSLKLIFSGFEVLMSTSKLQSMSFELRLEIFFR